MARKRDKAGLPARLKNLPDPVTKLSRYLLWRHEWNEKRQIFVKTPYYVNGRKRYGTMGTKEDLGKLTTLPEAIKAYSADVDNYDGIGLALTEDKGIGAFDIDKCLDESGEMIPGHAGAYVARQAEKKGAYIEVSPSGVGLRILGPCDDPTAYSHNKLEYWGTDRYVTLTGSVWANPKGWKNLSKLRRTLPTREREKAKDKLDLDDVLITGKVIADIQSALSAVSSDERELWIRFGHALQSLGDKGKSLWMEWSAKSDKFNQADADYTWGTFKPTDITYRSIFTEAQNNWDWENPKSIRDETGPDEEQAREGETLLDYALDFGEYGLEPTEFVLDGFMGVGLNLLSGGWGAGKSTNLIPLAGSVAHLTPERWGFHPELRRKILWVTEAPEQAKDVIYSLTKDKGSAGWKEWAKWFYIVPAVREFPKALAKQIQKTIPELTYTLPNGFAVRPLVVLDTVSANVELDNESDNSEVAAVMARLKERLRGVPLLLVGHSTKAASKGPASNMTFRGASAWEADASATYFLAQDEETGVRYVSIGKIRFKPDFNTVVFGSQSGEEKVETEWGNPQTKGYVHGVPERSSGGDMERIMNSPKSAKEAFQETKEEEETPRQGSIVGVLNDLYDQGIFATEAQITTLVGGPKALVPAALETLVGSGKVRRIQDLPKAVRKGWKGRKPKGFYLLPGQDLADLETRWRTRQKEGEKG